MEFKTVYEKNGKSDLISQVPYLSRLAEHYEAAASLNGNDWVNLLKVCHLSDFLDVLNITMDWIIHERGDLC